MGERGSFPEKWVNSPTMKAPLSVTPNCVTRLPPKLACMACLMNAVVAVRWPCMRAKTRHTSASQGFKLTVYRNVILQKVLYLHLLYPSPACSSPFPYRSVRLSIA